MLVKQVGLSYSSTCCFTEMSDSFVSSATWVGSCFSGGFVWKHVVSLKTLLLLRDVTGKAPLSSAVVWFFVEMDSVLCCWFCDVTESLIGFSQPVLRRESSGLASGLRWRAMEGRSKKQESERNTVAPRFKLSDFGPAHRRLVESECPYGAEPCLARFLGPCLRHMILSSYHEKYPYRPLYMRTQTL